MEHIKSFEGFLNEWELNENVMKVPARITDPEELDQYFWPDSAKKAKQIWRSNSTIILPAKNDKKYRITYISKGGNRYLQLKLVK